MQTNKVIQLVALALLMLLSMIAVSTLLEVRETTRNLLLGLGLFVLLLTTLWRNVPIDGKLLFIVIMGYALGGKGFAYVSPFEPIYIGEITLLLCMLGFAFRPKQMSLIDTPIHKFIWPYLIYSGIHLIVDFESYRLLAIRDSSMAYYSLYFIASYSLFQNGRVAYTFERVIKLAAILSVCSMLYHATGLELVVVGFSPHIDAYIPLSIGLVLYCLIIGVEKRKMHYVFVACFIIILLVASSKTAALMALIAVIMCAITFGRIKTLIMPTVLLLMILLVALSAVMFIDIDVALNLLTGGKTAETFGLQGGEFVGFSGTSQWRLLWWTVIWQDTLQIAPFWGQGFGADITAPFLEAWLGIEYSDSTNYARYPHNVMLTNFGRLGFIGLAMFFALFFMMSIFMLKFCRKNFCSNQRHDADIICFGIVLAGMVNAVLQATYEVPYGAITHWTCLAYLATRYYLPATEGKPSALTANLVEESSVPSIHNVRQP